MKRPDIKSTRAVVPMIYAYTTPGIAYHDGYIKIGYTEQDVDARIKQQTHTAGIKAKKEWQGTAVFDDGSGDTFKDKDLHAYLRKNDVKQPMDMGNEYFRENDKNEWFYISPAESRSMFNEFRSNRGVKTSGHAIVPYTLRAEQKSAVELTKAYFDAHEGGEFLWNAKPRFGKTLSVYDLCKRIPAKKVLIVTNRPAIANSWYSDYERFIGRESGYFFVSETDALKNNPYVMPYDVYEKDRKSREKAGGDVVEMGIIYFVSLQDMKGSVYLGGAHPKLKELVSTKWDLLVVDEAHEGVDTYKTDVAFDKISRRFTLHLSGTPFKALANNKFDDNAIYNYTYADEQERKRDWNEADGPENPYASLPRLSLYTYQMSEIVRDELSQGIEIRGETEEYAFDLNEFFRTQNGKFVYNTSVDKFLDALTLQEKFPFSTPELRDELRHTFWLLDRVESAKAMAKKLRAHPVFKDYEVILAAGDGRIDDDDENEKSYNKVERAISEHEKTITLSVGQLTTGVTVPEWTAVLMLSNVKSPSLYMQAAFRAQNPCMFTYGTEHRRKENAYVFDFDPARTLIIFEEFANDLSANTAAGRGDAGTRKENIRKLLNFFPVIGEDEDGELIELDAEKVMSIPRRIKSVEVVRRGFMSNFLFQNIGNIFSAPKEVIEMIEQFEPIDEKRQVKLSDEVKKDLSLDENGEVDLEEGYVIGKANDIFGSKIYDEAHAIIDEAIETVERNEMNRAIKGFVKENIIMDIIASAKDSYGPKMKVRDENQLESALVTAADMMIDRSVGNYQIEKNVIEQERIEAQQKRHETGRTTEEINKEFDEKQKKADSRFKNELNALVDDFTKTAETEAVKTVETKIRERERDTIEDGIRDHLRGFSRTIPSFLMAYGDETVTLATFDSVVPDKVFSEVTSITLEQFRFLRDGGVYKDAETGEEKEFKGQLFDPVVFDDSVKEFLSLKKKLANYFDEKSIEDIFDYIPPQKTNQIFTPKDVVKRMVDMLEEENPGCFDMPDKTFIDLYMKSGLYITEIVKRLYQSEKMKKQFPDDAQRLRHIFEHQVYGLAPTEIIYKIATSYILGFDETISIEKHNFRQVDALPYAKDGTLSEKLDEIFN